MNAQFEKILKEILGDRNVKGTNIPSIFLVKGNLISKISGKLNLKQHSLVDELRRQHPYAYLWITSWNEGLLKKVQTSRWEQVSNNLWLIPREESTKKFLHQSYEGAWGLLFCDQPFSATISLEYLPLKPVEIENFLNSSNAVVAIISWYDDTEWFIGSKTESATQ